MKTRPSRFAAARTAAVEISGGWIHRAAGRARTTFGPASAADQDGRPLRLAGLWGAFIRYGTAQAIGLQAAGADVTFYYVDRLGEFDGNESDRRVFLDRVVAAGI